MTALIATAAQKSHVADDDLDAVLAAACNVIAPTWPLDRFIAVNPFWERISEPLPSVAAKLAALSGARLLMPRGWFLEAWKKGQFRDEHLEEAIAQSGAAITVADLHALMETTAPPPTRRARVMDVADSLRDLTRAMSWREFVTHSTSQFCASYFDDGQARLAPDRTDGLYASWRRQALHDLSPALLMGFDDYLHTARKLPPTARDMARVALGELGVPRAERHAYLSGLLVDLNGWASWCAYRRWTARLAGQHDDHITELLAIRLAWEWLLFRAGESGLAAKWPAAMADWKAIDTAASTAQRSDWLLQRALEIAWQDDLCRRLPEGFRIAAADAPVVVQAAFCIDVRSEVFRRALEAQDARVQTLGFAGFFGMPIEYKPIGSTSARPQLPGLLAPRFRVTDSGAPAGLAPLRAARLDVDSAWKDFKTSALSSFAFVESMGLLFGAKLIASTLGHGSAEAPERAGLTAREDALRKPRLNELAGGGPLGISERCALAEGMLRAMSLTRDFARLVLLVGHGSQTRNNPHAAGLDCGACCGQTGEVNARAAAALLNEPEVRRHLATRGIDIPETTHFVAALHDTTTDVITLFDLDELPQSHASDVEVARGWLDAASNQARRERAPKLAIAGSSDDAVLAAVRARARDWAQVRPEWGLADNAAFIVAPRSRCRHMHLAGRAFLHDYRFEDDRDFSILELIMTAPMIVTHWINLQYYASTVDNARYGSGNKVLHNVVGGHLGVFEGNGGDLRIGLPMQSVHDGERWIHTPLRLSVFIEAPCSAIDAVLEKHETVRALVENEWIYLFQLDAQASAVRGYRQRAWSDVTKENA